MFSFCRSEEKSDVQDVEVVAGKPATAAEITEWERVSQYPRTRPIDIIGLYYESML